jgi:hypothetical protein
MESLVKYQLSTLSSRRGGSQSWEEWQTDTACPLSLKKRKADLDGAIKIPEDTPLQVVQHAVANALQGFAAPTAAGGLLEDSISKVQMQLTQLVTQTMNNVMVKMQVEADRRADAML